MNYVSVYFLSTQGSYSEVTIIFKQHNSVDFLYQRIAQSDRLLTWSNAKGSMRLILTTEL